METRPKKILLTLLFTVAPLLFLDVPRIFSKFNIQVAPHLNWLSTLRILLIAYSIIYLFIPWLLRKKLPSLRRSYLLSFHKEIRPLVNGLSFTVAPSVLGFILFIFGSPALELPYFVIPAAIDSLLWGIYNIFFVVENEEL